MKQTGLLILLFAVLLSCNDTTTSDNKKAPANKADAPKQSQATASIDLSGCYMRVLQRDTLAASLQQTGNKLAGKLSFDNFEKDASTGSVTGTIEGDIVKLTYTFQSEGTRSVMQVLFKIVGNDLIYGVGDMTSDSRYVNEAGISYPEANRLIKLDCALLPAKFK